MCELVGNVHLKQNACPKLIANKYDDGKVKQDFEQRDKYAWTCWIGNEGSQGILGRLQCVGTFAYQYLLCAGDEWVAHSASPRCQVISSHCLEWEQGTRRIAIGWMEVTVLASIVPCWWWAGSFCPVLKHGSRSLAHMQALWLHTCTHTHAHLIAWWVCMFRCVH